MKIEEVIDKMPAASAMEGLTALADRDPVLWSALNRRVKGEPLVYSNDRKLVPESLAEIKRTMIKSDYEDEHYSRLLHHRPFLKQPLRDQHKHKVYEKGRQMGVTELSATEVFWFLATHPGTKAISTFPRDKQLTDFSITRVSAAFAESPRMTALMGTPNQVFTKRIGDSYWIFRSAWEANLGEGVDADMVTLDEKDRMRDKVEFAFKESLKSSRYRLFREISTPTMPNHGIDIPFRASDQQVWMVKCERCNEWQEIDWKKNIVQVKDFPLGTKELPPESYDFLCHKTSCRGKLDRVYTGQWVARFPSREHIRGYHIPQLIAPWLTATRIMQDKIDLRFMEIWLCYVVGIPAAGELEMITDEDCESACAGHAMFKTRTKDYGMISVGVDWGNCHDSETRVLTDRGFIHFKDLTKSDKVAQWNADTRVMTFCRPKSITRNKHKGEMIHFSGKGVDMMVTPGHRMRVGNRWSGQWDTETAADMAERDHATLVGSVLWQGKETTSFTLPGLPKSPGYSGCEPHTIAMDVWLEFMGYYLSEGGLCFSRSNGGERPSCLKMSQRESAHPENVEKMRACLEATGLKYSEFPNQKTSDVNWTIYGKQMWSWVAEHVGSTCGTKRIPRMLMGVSRRQLQILFDAMMLGDGSYQGNGGCYYSTSLQLCENFQEICVRLGLRASVYVSTEAEGNKNTKYRTSWTTGRDRYWDRVEEHVERVDYDGEVFCCTVPDGYIVTERNGHIAYQGNCNWVVVMGRNNINSRPYVLAIAVFEDTTKELESAEMVWNFIKEFTPDMTVADAGYGKDRNSFLMRRLCPNGDEGKFYAQWYNSSIKHGKTFVPEWSDPARARVTVDRTLTLKNICRAIKERDFGIPDVTIPEVQLLIRHLKSLAPFREVDEETKEIVETVKSSGDDHLAHALASAALGMEKLSKTSKFSFDLI